jgi:hypothetical protein
MHLDYSGNLVVRVILGCKFIVATNTNPDSTGIQHEYTNVNDVSHASLYWIQGTFTGFRRVFTEDCGTFDKDDPQKFKDDYEGRIVVSTGKIATDTTDNDIKDNTEWQIV